MISSSTNSPNIRVISDENKLFATAAKIIADQLSSTIKQKGSATIALAGGRSAATLCEKLFKQKISWQNVHIFVIDERLVPINDEQSNFKIVNDSLIKPLNEKDNKTKKKSGKNSIPKENIHPFIYNPLVADEGAEHYNEELARAGGAFDVIFVSAGEDGHMAGLYPHHPLLSNRATGFATFHDSPKPPADRMTALPKNFLDANFSLLLIVGDAKREALNKLQNNNLTFKDCPSKLVTKSKNHLILTNLRKKK